MEQLLPLSAFPLADYCSFGPYIVASLTILEKNYNVVCWFTEYYLTTLTTLFTTKMCIPKSVKTMVLVQYPAK